MPSTTEIRVVQNKKDLMKVIHYAMLLLHFDEHYGTPSMPSGNFEQMP